MPICKSIFDYHVFFACSTFDVAICFNCLHFIRGKCQRARERANEHQNTLKHTQYNMLN